MLILMAENMPEQTKHYKLMGDLYSWAPKLLA